jgi:hypothetical protein
VNRSDGAYEDFDFTYRERNPTDEARDLDCGINFAFYDFEFEGRPYIPFWAWEAKGYGSTSTVIRQIFHTVSIARYRTDRLQVVLDKGHLSRPADQSTIADTNRLFPDIFLQWIEMRWGKEGKGYIDLKEGAAPHPPVGTPIPWLENDIPVEPDKLKELVNNGVIDAKTNQGAYIVLEWAKAYQKTYGQQSLDMTMDISLWVKEDYKTLKSRADKWKPRDR